jgi:hypothetical protein
MPGRASSLIEDQRPGGASRLAALLLIACLLCSARVAHAQQFVSTGRDTLRGLTGVEVIIETVPPEIARAGLSSQTIQAEIEGQLRQGHVTVHPSQQANSGPAQAYLYVHTNALSFDHDTRNAVAIQVQVRQTVQSLASVSKIVDAVTWDAHNVLVLPATDTAGVRAEIRAYIAAFIDDWAAVH